MGAVLVVVPLELGEGVRQMALVDDEDAVEEFPVAGAYLPFHDRVHARVSDAGPAADRLSAARTGLSAGTLPRSSMANATAPLRGQPSAGAGEVFGRHNLRGYAMAAMSPSSK